MSAIPPDAISIIVARFWIASSATTLCGTARSDGREAF